MLPLRARGQWSAGSTQTRTLPSTKYSRNAFRWGSSVVELSLAHYQHEPSWCIQPKQFILLTAKQLPKEHKVVHRRAIAHSKRLATRVILTDRPLQHEHQYSASMSGCRCKGVSEGAIWRRMTLKACSRQHTAAALLQSGPLCACCYGIVTDHQMH